MEWYSKALQHSLQFPAERKRKKERKKVRSEEMKGPHNCEAIESVKYLVSIFQKGIVLHPKYSIDVADNLQCKPRLTREMPPLEKRLVKALRLSSVSSSHALRACVRV